MGRSNRPTHYLRFHCDHCDLERSFPSEKDEVFHLQFCWEGVCAPQGILDVIGPLPVKPSIQCRPPIIQDRTRHAENKSKALGSP
jgi:hypothetical protein